MLFRAKLKVSHGRKYFRSDFFGFVVCEITPLVIASSFGIFFEVFVDAEKVFF